jgi:hypothetical protein
MGQSKNEVDNCLPLRIQFDSPGLLTGNQIALASNVILCRCTTRFSAQELVFVVFAELCSRATPLSACVIYDADPHICDTGALHSLSLRQMALVSIFATISLATDQDRGRPGFFQWFTGP